MNERLKNLWLKSVLKSNYYYQILYKISNIGFKVLKIFKTGFTSSNFRFFDFEIANGSREPSSYLLQKKCNHIFKSGDKRHVEIINNKLHFHEFCILKEIQTPVKIGEIKNGEIKWDSELPWLSNVSFLVKPAMGSQSKGIKDFIYLMDDTYLILDENREIKKEALLPYLQFFLNKGVYIIQERIKPNIRQAITV